MRSFDTLQLADIKVLLQYYSYNVAGRNDHYDAISTIIVMGLGVNTYLYSEYPSSSLLAGAIFSVKLLTRS